MTKARSTHAVVIPPATHRPIKTKSQETEKGKSIFESLKPEKNKSEKTKRNEFVLKLIALTIALSAIFGFAGAFIFNHYLADYLVIQRGDVHITTVEKNESTITEGLDPQSIPAVVEKTQNSVVAITTSTLTNSPVMGQYVKEGAGSGVVVSENGYIVTNTHVVNDATNIIVRLSNNQEFTATVIGADVATDITVIKIDANGLTPAVIGKSEDLIVGQTIVAIGNPLGELGGTVTSGIISAKDRELTINNQSMNLLQFSAAINPGNSGGGLFNLDGELVGIVNAKTSGSEVEGLGFAIPSTDALNIITQLIENGKVSGRPTLGISVIEIDTMSDAYNYIKDQVYQYIDSTGLYIATSENPHLFIGDKIMAIDGESITEATQIRNIINKKTVGDKISITISRNKKMETIEITLTEAY